MEKNMIFWRVISLIFALFMLFLIADSAQEVKRDRQPTSVVVDFDTNKYADVLQTLGIKPKEAKIRSELLRPFVTVRIAAAEDKHKIIVLKDGKTRKRLFANGIFVTIWFACFMSLLFSFLFPPVSFSTEKY